MKLSQSVIPATGVASLAWCGEKLVDWIGGSRVFHLDGKCEDARVIWAFSFDAVRSTSDGRYAILYQRLGTKALLLRDGQYLRELNRSFYHAHVYEYPVCIWQATDGRTLIAHCPERYCRIDIEDAETGACLTEGIRNPQDFFHSRLMVNSTGTRLLSAGWLWHPCDAVAYYDMAEALRNPTHLDGFPNAAPGSRYVGLAEENSACWQTTERVLLSGSAEEDDHQEEEIAEIGEPRLHARGLAVYDVGSRTYVKSAVLAEIAGTTMPIGESHLISFYRYPKLISLDSGEVVAKWEHLDTGNQTSSIIGRDTRIPPLAIDVEHRRFAVHGPDGIHVVQVNMND
jgi:hypothetical protein